MGLIKRDQTVYYAGSAQTYFPPKLGQFAIQCHHIVEMVKAHLRAMHLSNTSKEAASWAHFPWEQSPLLTIRVFQRLWVWSCLDMMGGSAAQGVTSGQAESWGLEMPEAVLQECLLDIAGWSTTNAVTWERVSCVSSVRVMWKPNRRMSR